MKKDHLCSKTESSNNLDVHWHPKARKINYLGKAINELKEDNSHIAYKVMDRNNDKFFFVKLCVDLEKVRELEEEYHSDNAVAIKSEDFGFGVWFGEKNGIRLYAKCNMGNAFFGLYWLVEHEAMKGIVEQKIEKAKSKQDLFMGLAALIMDAIAEYVEITGDVEWLDQQKYQELLEADKDIEGN